MAAAAGASIDGGTIVSPVAPSPVFIGTPGLPGASAVSATSSSVLDKIGNSVIGNVIGGGAISLGAQLDSSIASALLPDGSGLANTIQQAADKVTGANNHSLSSSLSGFTDLFLRGVVIILGFIFIAVGLTMFKSSAPILLKNVGNAAPKTVKRIVTGKK